MVEPARQYSVGSQYRYGFNGKEIGKEINESAYDFGARIYDGRISRWFSRDPLYKNYPGLSPYNAMGDNPIFLIDIEGKTIIINAHSKADLLKTIDNMAFYQMTREGGSTIRKLHESDINYIIKVHHGVSDQYTPSAHTMLFDPWEGKSNENGFEEFATFTFAHELEHADEDYRGNYFSRARSEAKALNAENYLRSVFGLKSFRTSYGKRSVDNSEDFKEYLNKNPETMSQGEKVVVTDRKIVGDIKLDSDDTYYLSTVGTYDANSKEITELKEGIVYFFDYKKDAKSKVEKKAVLMKVTYANKEKK